MLAITGDKGKPIPKPSFCLYNGSLNVKNELVMASSKSFQNKIREKERNESLLEKKSTNYNVNSFR